MTMISAIGIGGCEARVEALRSEFGSIMAVRIMETEAMDFLWEARVKQRYLGQHLDVGMDFGEDEVELSRIAILSFLDGRWHAATCLVDGEGLPVDLLWKQSFEGREEAEAAFQRAS